MVLLYTCCVVPVALDHNSDILGGSSDSDLVNFSSITLEESNLIECGRKVLYEPAGARESCGHEVHPERRFAHVVVGKPGNATRATSRRPTRRSATVSASDFLISVA